MIAGIAVNSAPTRPAQRSAINGDTKVAVNLIATQDAIRPPMWNAPSPARLIWFAENMMQTPVPVKISGIMDSTTFPILLLFVKGPISKYLMASSG